MRKIVTISREFGSGGRELGKRLSELLNMQYVDSEIVAEIARETNLDENYLNKKLEGGVGGFSSGYARSFSHINDFGQTAMLLACQHKIIKAMAADHDCIFIGRGAESVLGEYKPFRIFVYADEQSKIARCRERRKEGDTETDKEIVRNIRRIDQARRSTHDLYSATIWGDKAGYDLCVNTTKIKIEEIAPVIAQYILKYFEAYQT